MRIRGIIALLLVVAMVPQAVAQDPGSPTSSVYQVFLTVDGDSTAVLVPGDRHIFTATFQDNSRDHSSALTGQDNGAGVAKHRTAWVIEYPDDVNRIGWTVNGPGFSSTYGGDVIDVEIPVQVSNIVRTPVLSFSLVGTTSTAAGPLVTMANFTAITAGANVFNAQLQTAVQLAPREIASVPIKVTNGGLKPREFIFEVGENSCGLPIGYNGQIVVAPRTSDLVFVSVQGPEQKFWYSSELCNLKLDIFPADQPSNVRTLSLDPMITGTYVNPEWIFTSVGIILLAIIIFFLVARRKSRIEEEILGRPQKPWTIPVEMVYLKHLKQRDPQAHYVVRHFLMEEEYASSLLWYAEFKKATRGSRSKERLVVGQEHKVKRLRKKWEKRIAKPIKDADRFEMRLQKKLDRQGRKGLRERSKKWKKLTKKMEAAHEKKSAKIMAKWEKQVAKAEKKDLEVPAKPDIAAPDYPAEPSGDKVLLSEHKWNAKAVKNRAKANKTQGNLEVKFEKKEAKLLRKVRKRVSKIARKLDDPEFEQEHPLLHAAD